MSAADSMVRRNGFWSGVRDWFPLGTEFRGDDEDCGEPSVGAGICHGSCVSIPRPSDDRRSFNWPAVEIPRPRANWRPPTRVATVEVPKPQPKPNQRRRTRADNRPGYGHPGDRPSWECNAYAEPSDCGVGYDPTVRFLRSLGWSMDSIFKASQSRSAAADQALGMRVEFIACPASEWTSRASLMRSSGWQKCPYGFRVESGVASGFFRRIAR